MQRRNFVFIYFHAMQSRREKKHYIIGGVGIAGHGVDISTQVDMTGQPPGVFIGQGLVFPVQMGSQALIHYIWGALKVHWDLDCKKVKAHGVLVTVSVIAVKDKKDEVFRK